MKRRMSLMIAILALGALGAPCARAQEGDDESAIVERFEALEAKRTELEAQADARAKDATYFFELGNVYSDLSQRDKAIGAYESALTLDPDYVEVIVNLGSMLNEMGKSEEAIAMLERAAKLRPDESKVWVNLGNAHYSKSAYAEASRCYRKALEVDPSSYEAYYQFAIAFADVGIYREAIRLWQKVVDLAPDSDAARSAKENIEVVEQILSRRL